MTPRFLVKSSHQHSFYTRTTRLLFTYVSLCSNSSVTTDSFSTSALASKAEVTNTCNLQVDWPIEMFDEPSVIDEPVKEEDSVVYLLDLALILHLSTSKKSSILFYSETDLTEFSIHMLDQKLMQL